MRDLVGIVTVAACIVVGLSAIWALIIPISWVLIRWANYWFP